MRLAAVSLLLLLLLSGCGGAGSPHQPPDPQAARCEQAKASEARHEATAGGLSDQSDSIARVIGGDTRSPRTKELLVAAQLVVDEPTCFPPDTVAQARQFLAP